MQRAFIPTARGSAVDLAPPTSDSLLPGWADSDERENYIQLNVPRFYVDRFYHFLPLQNVGVIFFQINGVGFGGSWSLLLRLSYNSRSRISVRRIVFCGFVSQCLTIGKALKTLFSKQ